MRITGFALLLIILIILLAVMGHSTWHSQMLVAMNIVTGFFSGGHVVALWPTTRKRPPTRRSRRR